MKKIIVVLMILMLFLTSCGKLGDNSITDSFDNLFGNKGDSNSSFDDSNVNLPEGNQPEDNQPDDNQPEDNQPEDNQPDDNQPEDNQPEDNQPDDKDPDNTHTEHSYQATVTSPTCIAEGYTTYTCTCGDSYVSNEVAALGHNYKSVATAPTCELGGYTTYTCSVCSDSYEADKTSALGHSYKTTVTAATCENGGFTTYSCSVCNYSYEADKTSALGHSYKTTVTAATCENGGYTTYKCFNCADSYVADQTSALGHSYKATVTAATCENGGYTTYKCSSCNDSYVADQTSALGHSYKATVAAATCESDGYTTYICSVCSYSYTGETVSALGHNWKDATTSAPQTCTICGVTVGEKLPTEGGTSAYSDILYVDFINVGQGDSILIRVKDCDILIDAGTANYGETVSNYLKGKEVDDIELMINTHPDSDHCGGLTQVLNDFKVEEVWISKDTNKSTSAYKNFTSAITKEGLTAKKPNKGTVYTFEYLTLTVIYSEVGSDSNNSSIVIMLEYGSFRFLFTGDVGEEVETQLVSSGTDLSCDVLKVGHHGSKYSSTSAFLNATGAEYGVICVGSNSYGHPTSDALSRLSSAGVSVYRTDKNGDVAFSTDGATLTLPNGTTDNSGSGSGTSSGSSSSGGSSSGGSSGGSSSDGSTSSDLFIGNTETKVFHLPTCSNLPAASKQNTMYNYWWIINIAGYTPCGRCLKDYNPGSSSVTTYIANATSKVYHVSTCSYLPSASNQVVITSTSGYTPCSHCLGSSSTTKYIANTDSMVYHLSTCSYLPATSKQEVLYNTSGYTPCGHCIK